MVLKCRFYRWFTNIGQFEQIMSISLAEKTDSSHVLSGVINDKSRQKSAHLEANFCLNDIRFTVLDRAFKLKVLNTRKKDWTLTSGIQVAEESQPPAGPTAHPQGIVFT